MKTGPGSDLYFKWQIQKEETEGEKTAESWHKEIQKTAENWLGLAKDSVKANMAAFGKYYIKNLSGLPLPDRKFIDGGDDFALVLIWVKDGKSYELRFRHCWTHNKSSANGSIDEVFIDQNIGMTNKFLEKLRSAYEKK